MDKEEAVKKLRDFKASSGWTFDRLGREMDIPTATVTAWIQGRRFPSASAVRYIEKFLRGKK